MNKIITYLCLVLSFNSLAQENLNYQKPPAEILNLVDVARAPYVLTSENKDYMVLLYRHSYKTIDELSQEELRLGGLRIDPKTNIGSRVNYFNDLKIKNLTVNNTETNQVAGLPANCKMTNFSWSPEQNKLAFTNTTKQGVEIWVLDLVSASVKKLVESTVNANLGDVINWFEDGQSLLVKMVSKSKKELIDTKTMVPSGPTISISEGKKAQNRTYQDLLKSKNDEYNFEQLALS